MVFHGEAALSVVLDRHSLILDDHPTPPPDPLAVLTAAIDAPKPNPSTVTLNTPTFKWSAPGQYNEFQLFHESLNSWFHLQGVPAEADDTGDRTEYILNFLGTTGHRNFKQWKPTSATPDKCVTAKKSVEGFLDCLAMNVDQDVSQQCQIYQLGDISTGESLVSWLIAYMPLLTNVTSYK